MADAAKTLPTEVSGEWSIVLPRRSKHRTNQPTISDPEGTNQEWVSTDLQVDKDRESKLMHKLYICMKKLESSQFYEVLLDQFQNSGVTDCFSRVLKSVGKMQMVIYGIGSIESYEPPRLQLCLAILLKRKFDWISDIEVFDPVLSGTESRVLEALGCSVLSINEQGRRTACKPTLFFMPHCEAVLYNNLLEVNWKEDKLTNIALFGNSFEVYEQHVSLVKDAQLANSRKYILAARKFTQEFGIQTVSDEYFRPFLESSWHFFNPSTDEGFPIVGDIDPKKFNARASTFFILIIQLYIKQSLPSDPEEGTRKQLGRKFLPHRTGSPGWSLRAVLPRSHPTTPG